MVKKLGLPNLDAIGSLGFETGATERVLLQVVVCIRLFDQFADGRMLGTSSPSPSLRLVGAASRTRASASVHCKYVVPTNCQSEVSPSFHY
jgi:hypothetical protein